MMHTRRPTDPMTAFEFTVVVWVLSAFAGFLGALTGLGGGVVVVPALTLALGVDIKYAIGASLVSVIATSSGAAAAYVREGFSNIRIGMFLEIATTIGAIVGAFLAGRISTHALAIIFGLVLIQAAYHLSKACRRRRSPLNPTRSPASAARRLLSRRRQPQRIWRAQCSAPALAMMFGAGALSGLLGIGSGRGQGHRHGPHHAHSLQGLHHHQQLHDRRDCRGQRRALPQPRLYRSACRHAGDARRSGWSACSEPRSWSMRASNAAHRLRRGDSGLAIEMIVNGITGKVI